MNKIVIIIIAAIALSYLVYLSIPQVAYRSRGAMLLGEGAKLRDIFYLVHNDPTLEGQNIFVIENAAKPYLDKGQKIQFRDPESGLFYDWILLSNNSDVWLAAPRVVLNNSGIPSRLFIDPTGKMSVIPETDFERKVLKGRAVEGRLKMNDPK